VIRPTFIGRLQDGHGQAPARLHGSSATSAPDTVGLSQTVVPLPETSMRLLEFAIAAAALGFAVLLGIAH
jgi:hypothetical protein